MKLFKRSSKAAAENANLIVLSDGTYKEKGGKGGKKKGGRKTKKSKKSSSSSSPTNTKKKRGGLFSRKGKKSKSKQPPSKVLQAVTIQYPGIPTGEGGDVELDLSFETTTTELDQFMAELEAATPKKKEQPKPEAEESTSMLGRAFPSLFDEEGYMRCGCGPSSAPEDANDDDLTVTSGNKSSDKEKKNEVNIAATNSDATTSGDHSKTKDIATKNGDHSNKDINKNDNASAAVANTTTSTDNPKVNIEYVCNPSPKASDKSPTKTNNKKKDKEIWANKASALSKAAAAKGAVAAAKASDKSPAKTNSKKKEKEIWANKASALSKAAAAKGAVAAAKSTAVSKKKALSKPPLHPTKTRKSTTSLAKTPSRIVAEGEYSGPVSLDAFFKEEEPDDDASKKEVEQITLMENYKSENESLKAEIQRLKHLKTLEDENASLKAEVLKLQMGMSVVSQMAQDMKEGGKGGQKDPAEIQKEWEEGSVTGMFVRLANMFDDDGFIKCMTPSE